MTEHFQINIWLSKLLEYYLGL